MSAELPVLFFDGGLPAEYVDLVEGRAIAVGPDEADLARATAVIAGAKRPWDAAAFALAPNLRVISRTGVGYDNVDVATARACGIEACYTPEAPTVSTAEHTITLLLAITKGLPAAVERARAGLAGAPPTAVSLEVDRAVLGLVGFGRIARRVATAAIGLGMRVVASDPFLAAIDDAPVELVAFDSLLAMSDVVSLHAPASAETRQLMSVATFASMKRGSYLVNCARGSLVDQDALLAAIESGQLAGAALDVTEPEPLPVDHPLLNHPRVIVTPHLASATAAGRRRLYQQGIDNALNVIHGRPATTIP